MHITNSKRQEKINKIMDGHTREERVLHCKQRKKGRNKQTNKQTKEERKKEKKERKERKI